MRLKQQITPSVNLTGTGGTVLTYTHSSVTAVTALARIQLGSNSKPIAGSGAYAISCLINGISLLPLTQLSVGSMTRVLTQSRHFLLAEGDSLQIKVLGQPTDTAVETVVELFDVTPAQLEQLVGPGEVAVDHNYGGVDALRILGPNGSGVDGALIRAYLASDWSAGRRSDDYIIGSTRTNVEGRWEQPLMLDPAAYTLTVYKQGEYQLQAVPLTVTEE